MSYKRKKSSASTNWLTLRICLLCAALLWASLAHGFSAPFTPGNIILSGGYGISWFLSEYRMDGALVQQIVVPQPDNQNVSGLQGVALDVAGRAYTINGGGFLSTYDPATDSWSHHTCPDWEPETNEQMAGVTVFNDWVFATDRVSDAESMTHGLVRFDTTDWSYVRFGQGETSLQVTMGGDGYLYVLNGNSGDSTALTVYDPQTMTSIRDLQLDADVASIAVTPDGSIYGVGQYQIVRFSADGSIVKQLDTGRFGAVSIALSSTGVLAANYWADQGTVITDTSLDACTSIPTMSGHLTFVEPVPEPSSLCALMATGVLGVLCFGRCRRKAQPRAT